MDGQEITEYAVRNLDGEWEFRRGQPGQLYTAEQWARDHLALGSRVLRRRVQVIEDWTELPPSGEAS
jgi:hypothetical protein